MTRNGALQQYRQIGAQSAVTEANPHRLIQMLLEGVLEKIAVAKGAMARNEVMQKSTHISEAINIVGGLQSSLNYDQGGEIAANLDRLYDYVVRRLLEANLHNDGAMLEEASRLLNEVKNGWDAISAADSQMAYEPSKAASPTSTASR
ncbi:flagellar protein FliS [Nitrosococcus halophilus Nc 4]|uniref:Flagellar secretion chaperone FliS n=1 Tax=Nitrosococcus halophilus (strain Nc4) TaxID=472759 RepID=D5BV77_NITHN|nr:flagellar export chaperone FliS [Nitrosococcus halophilus]ADE15427.1 flagellar protein FliS [Nitrosococcus halophilus Nc 4]